MYIIKSKNNKINILFIKIRQNNIKLYKKILALQVFILYNIREVKRYGRESKNEYLQN